MIDRGRGPGGRPAGLLATIAQRHEATEGRRVRLYTRISDRPGALAALLTAILYLPGRMRDACRQTFVALARAVESREPHLQGHAERTARYVTLMARWCGMPPWTTRRLEYAALMHGIGKVG